MYQTTPYSVRLQEKVQPQKDKEDEGDEKHTRLVSFAACPLPWPAPQRLILTRSIGEEAQDCMLVSQSCFLTLALGRGLDDQSRY